LKILVTGAGGLVGRAVASLCTSAGEDVIALDHRGLDISHPQSVKTTVSEAGPDVVINCAAWTDVDGCESDPAHAQAANGLGPELLASSCRDIDALLITISTDYVFDGRKDGFYTQEDQPNPISVYGRSKLEGEQRAQGAYPRTIIVRSGYIFGVGGNNFLSTFLARVRRGETLKAISDMIGTPTYAPDLARGLYRLAQIDAPGIYHVVNAGDGVSFEGFARAALRIAGLDPDLIQVTTLAALNRPAPRPRNSRLRCLRSEAIGLEPLPGWQDALADFVKAQSGAVQAARSGNPESP
jgi:dTDP-4-dehydrorhamnose reductase